MITQFTNAKVLRNHQLQLEDLWISEGKVIEPQASVDNTLDLHGKIIAPGFIELQINGATGIDFSSNPEKIDQAAKFLGRYGITSFLATIVSSSAQEYQRLIPMLQPRPGGECGAELLGIHLEGPCFNLQQSKAHSREFVRACSHFQTPQDCYGSLEGVRLVTLAPEIPGATAWIAWLKERDIVVSAGHSLASATQMNDAIDRGVSMATHLFNAMTPFHHRAAGMIGTILSRRGFYYTIIADGIHVDPLAVNLAWRSQPEGLILISDASAGLGMIHGTFSLGSKQVDVRQERVHIQGTDILAGSVIGLDKHMRNFHKFTGATVVEALETVSLKPAKAIQVYPQKGTLDIGADADFVVLDEDLHVQATYVTGELLWSSLRRSEL